MSITNSLSPDSNSSFDSLSPEDIQIEELEYEELVDVASEIKDEEIIPYIKLIIEQKLKNQEKFLEALIERLPLDDYNELDSSKILSYLLEICREQKNYIAVLVISAIWRNSIPSNEKIPYSAMLFAMPLISVEVLKFIESILTQKINLVWNIKNEARINSYTQIANDMTYMRIVAGLFFYEIAPMILGSMERTDEVFGAQRLIDYQNLYNAYSEQNRFVSVFLAEKIKGLAKHQEPPKWMNNWLSKKPSEDQLFIPNEILKSKTTKKKISSLSIDKPVDIFAKGLEVSTLSQEKISEIKTALKMIATNDHKHFVKVLQSVYDMEKLEDLQSDVYLFRILGPSNPYIDPTLEEMQFGGQRMFLKDPPKWDLEDLDQATETLGVPIEWFTGSCQQCLLKIKVRWYAFRMPLEFGSWYGCFCKPSCCREWNHNMNSYSPMIDVMIGITEDSMKKYGIQERINGKAGADPVLAKNTKQENEGLELVKTIGVFESTDDLGETAKSSSVIFDMGSVGIKSRKQSYIGSVAHDFSRRSIPKMAPDLPEALTTNPKIYMNKIKTILNKSPVVTESLD